MAQILAQSSIPPEMPTMAATSKQVPDTNDQEELRDLDGYKSPTQKFLLAHPRNRTYNGFQIHHPRYYHKCERAVRRDIRHIRYFKFRRQPLSHRTAYIKPNDFIQSASTMAAWKRDVEDGSHQHPKLPRCAKLLSVYGCIDNEPVRCLLDPGCQSQLVDSQFAAMHLAPARLEHTWYIESFPKAPPTPVTKCARLELDLGGHVEDLACFVTELNGYDLVLGLPWFEMHNPSVDYISRTLRFSPQCAGNCTQSESIEVRCDVKEAGCTLLSSPDDATPCRILALAASISAQDGKGQSRRTTRSSGKRQTAISIPATSNTSSSPMRGAARTSTIPANAHRPTHIPGGDDDYQNSDEDDQNNDDDDQIDDQIDDDYDEQDRHISTGSKRRAGAKAKKADGKRRKIKTPKVSTAVPRVQDVRTSLDIDNMGITPDDTTEILNRFLNLVAEHDLKAKDNVRPQYTPSFQQPQHVLDLPPWKPHERHFEFVQDSVALVPHVQPDGTNTRRWRMVARNTAANPNEEVELFLLPAVSNARDACPHCLTQGRNISKNCGRTPTGCRKCARANRSSACAQEISAREVLRFALMTKDVCSDKVKVIELGQIAVQAMNSAPFELKLPLWARYVQQMAGGAPPGIVSSEQKFITLSSLVRWKEQHWNGFDFRTLPVMDDIGAMKSEVYGSVFSTRWLTSLMSNKIPGKTTVRMSKVPAVWTTDRGDFFMTGIGSINLATSAALDSHAITAADFNAVEYPFLGNALADDANDDMKAFRDVYKMAALQLVGLVGTELAIRDRWEELTSSFTTEKRSTTRGPMNKLKIWQIWAPFSGRVVIIPSRELLRSLTVNGTTESLERDLSITTSVDDAACLAWIVQQSLDSLAKGERLLQIVFSAVVAAQRLESGLVTKQQVLGSYCACEDEAHEATTEHHCTQCWTIRACLHLSKAPTEEGMLLKCKGCAGRDFVRSSGRGPFSVSGRVKVMACNTLRSDARFCAVPWSREDFANMILEAYGTEDDKIFHDSYSGKNISLENAQWPLGHRSHGTAHPMQVSIEKPHSRYVRPDGTIVLHDPEHNAILTPVGVNRWKGNNPPSMLPLAKKALQLQLQVKDRPPCEGYYKDLQTDWELLEQAFDTQRVITSFGATTRAGRVASGQNLAQLAKFIAMEKSGIWDGVTAPPNLFYNMFSHRRSKHPDFSIDDEYWDWEVLMQDIEYMEKDIRPDGFNPHGLKLPRCGMHKIPWLWSKRLCPSDSDYDEAFIFDEFSGRLHTMDFLCDRAHKTDESPATLFLEYVAQWLENGGKCHIFGCVMTPLAGHFSRFSYGRGILQRRRAGDKRAPRRIEAGERMQTGCTKLLPRNMAEDYDVSRRTVIIETWKANVLRWDFPNLPTLIETLQQMVLSLQDSCEWYTAPSTNPTDYDKVPLPTKKNHTGWAAAMRSEMRARGRTASRIVEPDDENSSDDLELGGPNDDVVDDDEIATYEAHQNEVMAIRSTTTRDSMQTRCTRLREAAQNLGCIGDKYVSDLLGEFFGLLKDGGDGPDVGKKDDSDRDYGGVSRFQNIARDLDEYMQSLGRSEGQGLAERPATTPRSTRPTVQQLTTSGRDNRRPHAVAPPHRKVSQAMLNRPQHSLIENATSTTCFADSATQVLLRVPGVKEILLENSNFVYKPQSGRLENLSTQDLSVIQAMCLELQSICNRMFSNPGVLIDRATVTRFFKRVGEVDSEFRQGQYNDASIFLNLLIDTIVTATDKSVSYELRRFQDQQHKLEQEGRLPPAHETALQQYQAFAASGRLSPIHDLFSIILVKEIPCGEGDDRCPGISRRYDEASVLTLSFPNGTRDTESFPLEALLLNLTREETEGAECPMNKTHARGKLNIVRLASTSKYFTLSVNRQGNALLRDGRDRMNQVELPDDLDIAPYSDLIRLPSDLRHGILPSGTQLMYRLFEVIMYKGAHYIAFAFIDNEWICFDGLRMSKSPYAWDPRAAAAEGWITTLVVYERQKARVIDSALDQGVAPGHRGGTEKPTSAPSPGQTTAPVNDESRRQSVPSYQQDDIQMTDAPTLPTASQQDASLEAEARRVREGAQLLREQQQQFLAMQEQYESNLSEREKLLTEREEQIAQKQGRLGEQQRAFEQQQELFIRSKENQFKELKIRELQEKRASNAELIGRVDSLSAAIALQSSQLAQQKADIEKRNEEIRQELIVLVGGQMEE